MTSERDFQRSIDAYLRDFRKHIRPIRNGSLDNLSKVYVRQEEIYAEKVRFLVHQLQLPVKQVRVLDIGSSAGGLSVAMALEGMSVCGIEPSVAGMEVSQMRAKRLHVSNAFFQQGVGEYLPYKSATFDLVVSLAVLEHVQDIGRVLHEVFRVLKPGGWAYFEVPNNLFPFEGHYKFVWLPMMPKPLAKRYVRLRGGYPEFLDHLHYMSRGIVTKHFRNAGFVEVRDLYAEYLKGKAVHAPWSRQPTRLCWIPWLANIVRWACGPLPTAWFINRAVYLLARKPQ